MKFKVCIFDDDQAVQRLFADISKGLGCETRMFSDPTEIGSAFSLIRSNERTDIVLTDLKMPKMNGIEFAEKIIQAGFYHRNIAIISGYWDETTLLQARSLDVQTFFKPVSVAVLIEWLRTRRNKADSMVFDL